MPSISNNYTISDLFGLIRFDPVDIACSTVHYYCPPFDLVSE